MGSGIPDLREQIGESKSQISSQAAADRSPTLVAAAPAELLAVAAQTAFAESLTADVMGAPPCIDGEAPCLGKLAV